MFVGRSDLLEQLDDLWRKRTASLVTCRGRRRIGKSTLIEHFADKTALVYAGELAKSVAAEDYFDFIVPAERLFEV